MPEIVVAKYGGTSMAEPFRVAEIIEANPEQRFVVLSAPGKSQARGIDVKVTDQLGDFTKYDLDGNQERELIGDIAFRYADDYREFGSETAAAAADIVRKTLERAHGQSPAFYAALGEMMSLECFSMATGITAGSVDWIRFSPEGRFLRDQTKLPPEYLRAANSVGPIAFGGFHGQDIHGNVHTFKRGGSDQAQLIIGRESGAVLGDRNVRCDNYTDVNGVLSANPNVVKPLLVPHPRTGEIVEVPRVQTISLLTRREGREGFHGGTGVLQGDSIRELDGTDVDVLVKNTFDPDHPGSLIVRERDASNDAHPIVGVTGRSDLVEVTVHEVGMADRVGYVAEILADLGRLGLSLEHMPASQDTFSVTLHYDQNDGGLSLGRIDAFADAVRDHLSDRASVEVEERGVVYMIGEQLRNPRAQANATVRAHGTARQQGVTINETVSNSSSPSLALLLENPGDVDKLVDAIHAFEVERTVDLFGRPNQRARDRLKLTDQD